MNKFLVIIGIALLVGVSCMEKIETPEDGTIRGHVVSNFGVDTLGLQPVPDADVSTFPPHRSTKTDSSGYFELSVFPRTYRIKAKSEPITLLCDTTYYDPPVAIDTVTDTVIATPDTIVYTIVSVLEQVVETQTATFDSVFTDEFDVDEGEVVDVGDIELPAFLETTAESLITVDTVAVDTLP